MQEREREREREREHLREQVRVRVRERLAHDAKKIEAAGRRWDDAEKTKRQAGFGATFSSQISLVFLRPAPAAVRTAPTKASDSKRLGVMVAFSGHVIGKD